MHRTLRVPFLFIPGLKGVHNDRPQGTKRGRCMKERLVFNTEVMERMGLFSEPLQQQPLCKPRRGDSQGRSHSPTARPRGSTVMTQSRNGKPLYECVVIPQHSLPRIPGEETKRLFPRLPPLLSSDTPNKSEPQKCTRDEVIIVKTKDSLANMLSQ